MSKENITLVYSAIIREKHTILSEYTDFSGNFSQIIIQIMKDIILKLEDIPNICRSFLFYGKYSFFFLKYNKIYIITMFPNVKINNKEIIFAFLYSIFEEIKSNKQLDIEKMDKMKAYTLSSFSQVFEQKIKLFNSNCNFFISLIKNLQFFKNFELPKNQFESEVQLPVLSKTQTHTEKKNKEDDDFSDLNKESLGISFNSVMTFDSFKDDFLEDKEQNNIILIENDKNENFIQEIEIKELNGSSDIIEKIKINDSNSTNKSEQLIKNNSNNNNTININNKCTTKTKVIIIVIILLILIIIGVVLGIVLPL